MSLWDNINKKRQRIKQGSGEKMRKKGDKGAPTPDQIKRAKGEEMEEGKMKQAMMRRQDMAKLASLYSKAMKVMPGSPAQKKIKAQIDQYRKELGMNESTESLEEATDLYNKGGIQIVRFAAGKGKLGVEITVKKGTSASEIGGQIILSDAQFKNLQRALPKIKLKQGLGEAVSPAQQAAIAISKKERGEKPKNECASEDDFKPHMMYDPKTGKGYMAKKYEDHVRMDKMGYTHEKPEVKEGKDDLFQVNVKGEGGATVRATSEKDAINKAFRKLGIATRFTRDRRFMTKVQVVPAESVEEVKESRAYRDAMRNMSARGATKGMARTKKDRDIEATDDDRKAASKNIIMQLRKAADLPTGANIEFDRGKGKVTRDQAKTALARFNALSKPNEKEKFQKSIKSLADIKKLLGR